MGAPSCAAKLAWTYSIPAAGEVAIGNPTVVTYPADRHPDWARGGPLAGRGPLRALWSCFAQDQSYDPSARNRLRRPHPLLAGFVLWMVGLGVAFYAAPFAWQGVVWAVIGASSATAVIIGTRTFRPRRRLPWLWIAGGILAFSVGDAIDAAVIRSEGQQPFPSLGDAIYAVTFVLLVAGLMNLARSGVRGYDRAGLLDVLTVTVSFALLAWIFLFDRYAADPGLTAIQKLITIAYPLGDVVLLATALRLVTAKPRNVSAPALAVGAIGLLVADMLFGMRRLDGSWQPGGPVDVGWLTFYVAWGAAALHPSMVTLTEPRTVRQTELGGRRLLALALASLIAPAILLVEAVRGPVHDGGVIAISSAALFLLVLARLAGVADRHRRSLARERVLRQASAALAAATDRAGVEDAVRGGAAQMLPPRVPHRIAFVPGLDPPAKADRDPTRTADPVLYRRSELAPRDAELLADFDVALVCPLAVTGDTNSGQQVGVLLLAAPETELATLSATFAVLASQAAGALERVGLSAEIARRGSEEYFQTLVRNATDVILILNEDGTLRYATPSAAALFGAGPSPGTTLDELIPPDDRGSALARHAAGAPWGGGGEDTDWTVRRLDGGEATVEVSYQDLRDDPSVRGIVLTLRDVTEQRRLEQELTYRAFHDSLTGLPNRALFHDLLDQAMAGASERRGLVAVLFVDVDNLKVVNDTLGHDAGDVMLLTVARRLEEAVGSRDTPARLGGDEFAVLLDDVESVDVADALAERINAALGQPVQIADITLASSASIGVATSADAGDSTELLRQADLAVYVAKAAGKGQWRRYHATRDAALVRRLNLRGELDQALAEHAFKLRYQPIVDLETGRPVGFEALLRWEQPGRDAIPPGELIAAAEESGLIVPLGDWVLARATADAARWRQGVPAAEAPYLTVNVSAVQFLSATLTDRINRTLADTGLPVSALVIEITESVLLRDEEQVRANLRALREAGIRVAVDDFGTGYSSLSYLARVSVDVLKLDRSFIEPITTSAQHRLLVQTIARLGQSLGLDVVAEGVEHAAQRDILVDMGCQYGQGYLFAGPMRYDQLIRYRDTAR